MNHLPLSAPFVLAVSVAAGAAAAAVEDAPVVRWRVQERVVIRIPRVGPAQSATPATLPQVTTWKEKKGPKCLATATLAGALITKPDTIDLVMAGGDRFRAELDDDCPQLGFYSGFYIKPSGDGRVCAERDAVRARSGRACPIKRFRRLEARRPRRPD